MTDFLKIWRFELRRQRLNLAIAFLMIAVLGILAFGGIFPHAWKDNLAETFLLTVPLGGLFLSLDVFTRDFQQGTAPFFFSLPVKPWKVYLAKYFFSAFLFLVILVISIAMTTLFTPLGTLQRGVGWIDLNDRIIAVFQAMTAFAVILLYFHVSVIMWCVAFRGTVGIAASFFLIPLVTLLLYPSFVWFSRDYPVTLYECVPQILVYMLILIFICGIYWCCGIGRGRPMWILALKSLGVLFAASVLSFWLFYGIQITEYMITLSRFENTPGIEIPRGKISVIRSIWEGKAPKSADDVLNADLKTTVEIPVADYGKYADRLQRFFLESNDFITREIRLKHYDRVLRLLDAYESIPESVIPQVTWISLLQKRSEFDENGSWKGIDRKEVFLEADTFVPSKFYQDKYRLKGESGDEKKDMPYLILPFEKDTLPFLDKMIERMEKQPDWKERPIRVLPLGKEIVWAFSRKVSRRYDQGLRSFLPGIEKKGFSRFLEVIPFAFRNRFGWNPVFNYIYGGNLRSATRSMKAWIWSAGQRAIFADAAAHGKTLSLQDLSQITDDIFYMDYSLGDDIVYNVQRKHLWVQRLKLRKYALEHGTLPEKLSDALAENEIKAKACGVEYQLEYCIPASLEKLYPKGTIICRDYNGTRRHPHLHLVQKKPYHSSFYKCELDEPEEPLPEKGVLK